MRTTAAIPTAVAAVLTGAALSIPATPALATVETAASGCVSNAEFSRLAQGQRLSYVRQIVGAGNQTGMRYWQRGGLRYQERLYAMCTPSDAAHGTLTTRFMAYDGAWRAYLVDTYVGPEN